MVERLSEVDVGDEDVEGRNPEAEVEAEDETRSARAFERARD